MNVPLNALARAHGFAHPTDRPCLTSQPADPPLASPAHVMQSSSEHAGLRVSLSPALDTRYLDEHATYPSDALPAKRNPLSSNE